MKVRIVTMAAVALAVASTAARAADPRYPDWPCTQAKVPDISLAAVWAGPRARRRRDQMEGRRKGQRAGLKTVGAEDAAGRGREVGEGVSGRLRR